MCSGVVAEKESVVGVDRNDMPGICNRGESAKATWQAMPARNRLRLIDRKNAGGRRALHSEGLASNCV
jgi:hypothetical protein